MFFLYAATMGLTIGVIVWSYLQTPGGSTAVASAFLSASAMFAGAAVYGAVTKRELAKLGGLLFMALIGLIVASVVNWFLHSSSVDWVISIAGVLIFVGLTAYHVQRITRGDYAAFTQSKEKASVLAALSPLPELHQPVPVPAADLRQQPGLGARSGLRAGSRSPGCGAPHREIARRGLVEARMRSVTPRIHQRGGLASGSVVLDAAGSRITSLERRSSGA